MKTNKDDSAMPYHVPGSYDDRYTATGLTKREYFAGLAMQGLISDQTWIKPNEVREIAERAVLIADGLIAELNSST